MSYPIDHRLLRLAGELLASGSGTFGDTEMSRMFAGALEDSTLYRAETAAILVAFATVLPRLDAQARARFTPVMDSLRKDDPDLGTWIAESISASLLQRAANLIAGRGRQYEVPRGAVVDLMTAAYRGGPGPTTGISPDEALAFLVIRELLDGRLAADALALLDELCAMIGEDGYSLGSRLPSTGTATSTASGAQQCGACSGMGSVTCSSCGGHGYHRRSSTRTRYDGSTEYYQENIPCGCSSGRVRCGSCGGAGRR